MVDRVVILRLVMIIAWKLLPLAFEYVSHYMEPVARYVAGKSVIGLDDEIVVHGQLYSSHVRHHLLCLGLYNALGRCTLKALSIEDMYILQS